MHADPLLQTQTQAQAHPATPDVAIVLRGVEKRFGATRAVDGVDLDIRRGEVFGLIGHNGAGKSTLFKLLLGLLRPDAGSLHIDGRLIGGPGFRELRRQVGYLPESVVLWDNLSGLETLRFFARLKGVDSAGCEEALAQVGLGDAARRAVRGYSKGMRQRLGFAQALLGRPQVLLLDEPTNGLDPQAIRHFYERIAALRDQGVTIVISSHILAELQSRVDRLAVLSSGRVQALGSVAQLREAHRLPLTVSLQLSAGADAEARALLAALSVQWLDGAAGAQGLRLSCPRVHKVALLQALAALGPRLLDVQIDEASLEQIYFSAGAGVAP